jgi:hypothetical protein
MIEQLFKALHHYNEAYRELINEKAMRHTPDHGDFEVFIQSALKLTKAEDWGFICSSMDIINDSLLGIEHFCKYGLDGPTKYDDFGEKYIRLYGVLNATYIQQQALLNLHRIANVPNLRDIESTVAKLQVREVRNKLGAHSVDYANREAGNTESFVPVRFTLSGMRCDYYSNKTLQHTEVDLKVILGEHVDLMNNMYDAIYRKSVGTIYKANKDKREELLEKIDDAKVLRNGGIVMRTPDGKRIFITAFESDKQD